MLFIFLKRLFDILASFFGLLILWPVLVIVAILIKVKMPGSVLFVQERVGRGGKLFKCHKFRSMRMRNADEEFTGVAAAEVSRITPLGEKLRRYNLDELPELWDVLIGKMSVRGPAPGCARLCRQSPPEPLLPQALLLPDGHQNDLRHRAGEED